MHIPDNFLSTPVWATLDAVSLTTFGLIARKATRDLEEKQIPLLGVLGAFVFAAQMVNFPVGVGTSGHLVGGALLACTLGPAPATIVMTAILLIQAFVFQDGGVLALGANVFNMAIVGVLAGYLPYRIWGETRWRRLSIFLGAFLSLMLSAILALSELLISGVPIPRPVLLVSLALFVISALIEGAITVSVLGAIGRINPAWLERGKPVGRRPLLALAGAALVLAIAGFLIASTQPDGLEHLGLQLGLAAKTTLRAPLADYSLPFLESAWVRKAAAGLAGLLAIYGVCSFLGRILVKPRSV